MSRSTIVLVVTLVVLTVAVGAEGALLLHDNEAISSLRAHPVAGPSGPAGPRGPAGPAGAPGGQAVPAKAPSTPALTADQARAACVTQARAEYPTTNPGDLYVTGFTLDQMKALNRCMISDSFAAPYPEQGT